MTQKIIWEFDDVSDARQEEVSDVIIFSTKDKDKFIQIYKTKYGHRPPSSAWHHYWDLNPEDFQKRFGRSWESAKAAIKRINKGRK